MGKRGPPPAPTQTLKLTGSFQHSRKRYAHRLTEMQSEGVPECPDRLQGDARLWWEENVPKIVACGVAKSIDVVGLENAAHAWAGWQKTLRMRPRGQAATIKVLRAQQNASTHYRQWQALFGMTPSDRTRIQAEPKEKQDISKEFLG